VLHRVEGGFGHGRPEPFELCVAQAQTDHGRGNLPRGEALMTWLTR
jgi:hypothetical protein